MLSLLARGLTGAAIAAQLGLSRETVRTHIRNAMRKLQASTRVHAVATAVLEGEITLGGYSPAEDPRCPAAGADDANDLLRSGVLPSSMADTELAGALAAAEQFEADSLC